MVIFNSYGKRRVWKMPSIYLGYPCAPQTKEPCVLLSQIHSWTSHWHWLALVSVALQHRKKTLANCIKFWSWLLSKPRTISLLAGCIYIYNYIYIYVVFLLSSIFLARDILELLYLQSAGWSTRPNGLILLANLRQPHYNGRDIPKSTAYAARFTQQ